MCVHSEGAGWSRPASASDGVFLCVFARGGRRYTSECEQSQCSDQDRQWEMQQSAARSSFSVRVGFELVDVREFRLQRELCSSTFRFWFTQLCWWEARTVCKSCSGKPQLRSCGHAREHLGPGGSIAGFGGTGSRQQWQSQP